MVKRLHALGLRALNQAHHLNQLAFHHVVRHGRRVNQQVHNRGTTAFNQTRQTLPDDADHVERQVQQHLFVLLFGVEVHDTFHRLHGVVGMDGEEYQVACLRELQGIFHGVFVTHLPHADHIGRLTHR